MTPAMSGGLEAGGLLQIENWIMHAAVHWTQKQIPNLINKQRALNKKHAL